MLPLRGTARKILRQPFSAIARSLRPPLPPPKRITPPHRPYSLIGSSPCYTYLSRRTLAPSSPLSRYALTSTHSFAPASTWARLQYPTMALVLHSQFFHSTPPAHFSPHFLIVFLKSSYTLSAIQFIGRLTMSLIPFLFIKGRFQAILMNNINLEENPQLAGQYAKYSEHARKLHNLAWILISTPFVFLGVTVLASSERTPLTGRWRVILLSPAEEEAIASDLQGFKWFDAVRDILAESNGGVVPTVVPRNDWRWGWVETTLRRLEQSVMVLHEDEEYRQAYHNSIANWTDAENIPLIPPPPTYPLLPRPRATSLLHEMPLTADDDHTLASDIAREHTHHIPPHTLLGPPYSLLIVNKDESNAFSYGFGPKGGGGVVVYSGFLDDILGPSSSKPGPSNSWSGFLSGFIPFNASPSRSSEFVAPTAEQTTQLAILLAHELSHLILSHHIETLSSGTILFPTVVSICVDTVRTILYPITFLFGPFVSDALDSSLRIGVDEVTKAGESCTSRKLEIEADIISTRLLALAGFDPRVAVAFWEQRVIASSQAEKSGGGSVAPATFWRKSAAHGSSPEDAGRFTHPVHEERVDRLKDELEGWAYQAAEAWQKHRKHDSSDTQSQALAT